MSFGLPFHHICINLNTFHKKEVLQVDTLVVVGEVVFLTVKSDDYVLFRRKSLLSILRRGEATKDPYSIL